MKTKKSRWILLGLIAVLAFIGSTALDCSFGITFDYSPYLYVVGPDGETALSDLTVGLYSDGVSIASTTTDTYGKASFGENLAYGTYDVVVTATDAYTFTGYTVIVGDTSSYLGTIIAEEVFNWTANYPSAIVVDEAGAVIASVVVTLTPATGTALTATSDTAGVAAFTGFTAANIGTYTMTAALTGSAYTFQTYTVTIDETSVFLGYIEGTLPPTVAISGSVIDVKSSTAAGVDGAVVTATAGTVTFEATTSSTGAFTITADPGNYTLTAVKTGYFVVSTDVVAPLDTNVGTMVAVPVETNAAFAGSAISIIALWNDTYQDIDTSLTMPDGDGTGLAQEALVETTYDGPADVTYATTSSDFGPLSANSREKIYGTYGSDNTIEQVLGLTAGTDTRKAVQGDRDEMDGNGPETISIRTVPIWPESSEGVAANPIATGFAGTAYAVGGNYLPVNGPDGGVAQYLWGGVMTYYVHGYSAESQIPDTEATAADLISSSGTTGGADLIVYVTQGSTLLAKFVWPEGTDMRTASFFKIHFFVGRDASAAAGVTFVYYQIIPDMAILSGTSGIKGVGSAPAMSTAFGPGRTF